MSHTPFTDPAQVAALYTDPDRTYRRTSAVHTAKIAGEDVTARIVELAADHSPPSPVVCSRVTTAGHSITPVRADFHHLPLISGSVDLIVAAFCLYHSRQPETVISQIATALADVTVVHSEHRFVFPDFNHLATYVTTTPKYQLRQYLYDNPRHLAAALRERVIEQPLVATSTVTYAIATRS